MSNNHVYFIGNLGDKPELFKKGDAQALARFSIAVKETWLADGEVKECTDWFPVAVYGRCAEAASLHLQKGSKVFVTGKMRTRSYQTKNGDTRHETFLAAQDVQFLSTPKAKSEDTVTVVNDLDADADHDDMPESMLDA